MRLLQWIFTDPLAQLTLLASVSGAALLMLVVHKVMTRGRSPRWPVLAYSALGFLMFAGPCTYFWHQINERNAPTGPLLHSTPVATLKTTSGESITLASLRGRVVLLDFWASWCAPCRLSTPAIAQMQKDYGSDLVTIGISVDDSEQDCRKALVGPRPAYDVFDHGQYLRWAFRVGPLPQFVVLDRSGMVVAIETGWENASVERLHQAVERNIADTASKR
jgi:cytochrome c biogenesis protein CcmG, thiol:disulfide interchange protein DsbE